MNEFRTILNTVVQNDQYATFRLEAENKVSAPLDEIYDKPFQPGQRLFEWNVEYVRFLGEGAFSTVHQVKYLTSAECLAVKTIKHSLHKNQEIISLFKEEALKYIQLGIHDNIIQAISLEYSKNGGVEVPWLFLELLKGRTLRDYLAVWHSKNTHQAEGIKSSTVLTVAHGIASGLKYASEKGVYHHDIKPENIIITEPTLVPKILDFGGALTVSKIGLKDKSSLIFGTPEYSSPEHYELNEYDVRSEIYCFGILLYEMFTGSIPFSFTDRVKYKNMNLRRLNIPVSVPNIIKTLITDCLHPDKNERLSDFREVIEKIAEAYHFVTGRNFEDQKKLESREQILAHADFLSNMEYYEEAEKIYERAASFVLLENQTDSWYADYAFSLFKQGKYSEAESAIQKITFHTPETLNILTLIYLEIGRHREAAELLEEFLQKGYNPSVQTNLIICLHFSDQCRKAEELLLDLLTKSPSADSFNLAQVVYYGNNQFSSALKYAKETLKYSDYYKYYTDIADIYNEIKDYSSAEEWAFRAMEKCSDKNEIYAWLIRFYSFSYSRQKSIAETALRLYPGNKSIVSAIKASFIEGDSILNQLGMTEKEFSRDQKMLPNKIREMIESEGQIEDIEPFLNKITDEFLKARLYAEYFSEKNPEEFLKYAEKAHKLRPSVLITHLTQKRVK